MESSFSYELDAIVPAIGPIYTDDGVNWNPGSSGLPADASTRAGGANTQGMNIDPATGYVYIVLKNGDVYRTTVPQ